MIQNVARIIAYTMILACICHCKSISGRSTIRYSANVMEALCQVRKMENIPGNQKVKLANITQPNVDILSLRLLYDPNSANAATFERDDQRAARIVDNFHPQRIIIPELPDGCGIELTTESMSDLYGSDSLLLEISNPVRNPFSKEFHTGIFVRFSLGGVNSASWYWFSPVPTTANNPVIVHPLEITEM